MSAPANIAATPLPPNRAVIFTSRRTEADRGFGAMAERMVARAASPPGFLRVESARGADGLGITSSWRDEAFIAAWNRDTDHQQARHAGRQAWYADYQVRAAKVGRASGKPPV